MVRRVGPAIGMAVVAMVAAGCGDGGDATRSDDSDAWRTSTDPVSTSGLTWAAGSTVHFADGTSIDTGDYVSMFVVAGDGVFFVPTDTEEKAGSNSFFDDAELMFAAPGQPVTGTGLKVSADYVGASEDGRYLAVIETSSGEKDRFDTPQATVEAFDLETGEQVVDSTLGMGDPAEDDFADAYSESEMEIRLVTDTTLYVGAMGDYEFDLGNGEGKELVDGLPDVSGDPAVSPNGEWRIERPERGPMRIVGSERSEVLPATDGPRWNLFGWVDDGTVVGTQITGPNTGISTKPGDSVALMSCQVPSGECEVFEETAGQTIVFPLGTSFGSGIVLQDGGGS